MRAIETTMAVTRRQGRGDLADHLASTRDRLLGRLVTVAVVGEFKRGKSTLVNALLQTDVCPVDADVVTALPTLLRYGEPPSATAHLQDPGTEPVGSRPIALDRLTELVCESGDPLARRDVRSVEVRLPHRLLRSGVCLLDTPGVGGLDSAHGAATLGALVGAAAVLLVTDASQELTAAEMAFFRQAVQRCGTAACVVSKTDLYPQWRRIVDLDRAHLARAGLDVPVLPVSSFLRMAARLDPGLNDESGFVPLFDWLAGTVVAAAESEAVSVAAQDVDFARRQLDAQVRAERAVLAHPEESAQVVRGLEQAVVRHSRLGAGGAWQQALTDGVQDLVADVEHDLHERIREITREAEAVIDDGDPRTTWETLDRWLQHRVMTAVTDNYELMTSRAMELTAEVATAFAMECESVPGLDLRSAAGHLAELSLGSLDDSALRAGTTARMLFIGRSATYVPMVMFGMAGHLLGLTVLGPLSVALGLGIGRKVLRDERERQLALRRQQAKTAVRRYLDDVSFVVVKDCRDALRRTQRELRDEFRARAGVLESSARRALESGRAAAAAHPADRPERMARLARSAREIKALTGMLPDGAEARTPGAAP